MNFSIIWWNTSISPPLNPNSVKPKKNKPSKDDKIYNCIKIIDKLIDADYDFICLGEVAEQDVRCFEKHLLALQSNYTVINGAIKSGRLYFDTCVICKKIYQYEKTFKFREITYNDGGQNVRVGQRFEFNCLITKAEIVLYISHWPAERNSDSLNYNAIAQDLRNTLQPDLDADKLVILLGDYNIEPSNISIVKFLQTTREKKLIQKRKDFIYNPFWKYLSASQVQNLYEFDHQCTYFFKAPGKFNNNHIIDHIMFSRNFFKKPWKFDDDNIQIIDLNIIVGLNVSDHMAVSATIPREL